MVNNPPASVIPVTGMFAMMQPIPIGSSSTGSYSLTMAREIRIPPTAIMIR